MSGRAFLHSALLCAAAIALLALAAPPAHAQEEFTNGVGHTIDVQVNANGTVTVMDVDGAVTDQDTYSQDNASTADSDFGLPAGTVEGVIDRNTLP
jgi:hypothetical protein